MDEAGPLPRRWPGTPAPGAAAPPRAPPGTPGACCSAGRSSTVLKSFVDGMLQVSCIFTKILVFFAYFDKIRVFFAHFYKTHVFSAYFDKIRVFFAYFLKIKCAYFSRIFE